MQTDISSHHQQSSTAEFANHVKLHARSRPAVVASCPPLPPKWEVIVVLTTHGTEATRRCPGHTTDGLCRAGSGAGAALHYCGRRGAPATVIAPRRAPAPAAQAAPADRASSAHRAPSSLRSNDDEREEEGNLPVCFPIERIIAAAGQRARSR